MTTAADVQREIACAIDLIQREIDKIDALLDSLPGADDEAITLAVTNYETGERARVRFIDEESMARFLSTLLQEIA